MFQRRIPLTRTQKLREWLWPSMGWKRAGRYMLHRILRIQDSNHRIALGLAMGVAVSFTPVPGTHILQAVVFTVALRGNVLAALIGTLAGNPLTLPVMWWAAYEAGAFFFRLVGLPVEAMPSEFTLAHLAGELRHPWSLFLPWVAGGYLTGFLALVSSYIGFYWLVAKTRRQRMLWKQSHLHKTSLSITEKQT